MDLLLRSGLLDVEYYEACTGIAFTAEADAALHCIREGMPSGLSPNPLLDLSALPRATQAAWREGRIGVVLGYLKSAAEQDRPIGPLFDAAACPGTVTVKGTHPGGALGHFLETADGETQLPVPDNHLGKVPTLGEARQALCEHAALVRDHVRRTASEQLQVVQAADVEAWRKHLPHLETAASEEPLVSVLLRATGDSNGALRTLASVQGQTLENWELHFVEDGSDPAAEAAVKDAAATDARIHVCSVRSRGAGASLAALLSASQGRYIAFTDDLTPWHADFLATMVAGMRAQGVDVARAALRGLDPLVIDSKADEAETLLARHTAGLTGLVVTRALATEVGGFDPHLARAADRDFLIRLARQQTIRPFPVRAGETEPAPEDADDRARVDPWELEVTGRHVVDWAVVQESAPGRDRDVVSIVIPTYDDWRMTARAVRAVLADADRSGRSVEVVVVDNGSVRETSARLAGTLSWEPRVLYVRLPRNLNFSIGCNVGFARSHGSVVVFLNNDTIPQPGWLDRLLPALADRSVRGVQPLLLYPDDTIQTAGTVFAAKDFLPSHFLTGHPPEDAERLSDRSFPAVTAAALAMRAEELAQLRGFDPHYVNGMEDVDLCLRAVDRFGGRFRLEPTARVTHFEGKTPGRGAMIDANRRYFIQRWRGSLPRPFLHQYHQLGFKVAHLAADAGRPPIARPVVIRQPPSVRDGTPRLRWGLKLPTTPGPIGDAWGDTHFGESLKRALMRLGQEVVTYRRGSHTSPASHLDDVVLGLRGLEPVSPLPGKVNLLWVISHPDDVSAAELLGFDAVFAASKSWADAASVASGRPVRPLLQACDAQAARSAALTSTASHQLVFVGGTHPGRQRRAVLDAVEAGVPLAIHGHGWEATAAEGRVATEHVPNHELGALYRRHGLVLADHWPDMAANGFIANRVFDAVAAGARVISDDVPGIEEFFRGAVRVYRSVDHLRHLCSAGGRAEFASDKELGQVASWVAAEHTFDQRAMTLLETALDLLANARSLEPSADLHRMYA